MSLVRDGEMNMTAGAVAVPMLPDHVHHDACSRARATPILSCAWTGTCQSRWCTIVPVGNEGKAGSLLARGSMSECLERRGIKGLLGHLGGRAVRYSSWERMLENERVPKGKRVKV